MLDDVYAIITGVRVAVVSSQFVATVGYDVVYVDKSASGDSSASASSA